MEEKEIHLRDYIRVIRKRKLTVLTIFIVVFVLVFIKTISTTPIYMATTKIVIEKGENHFLIDHYGYAYYDPEFYETQYELIRSFIVARKVVDMLNLESTYDSYFKNGKRTLSFSFVGNISRWLGDIVRFVFGTKGIEEKESDIQKESENISKADMIAKSISGGIKVNPVKNTRVVDISYTSTNPEFAKLIANTVAQAYIEATLDLSMSSTRYTLEWMTKKAEEERAKIDKSEKELQQYMKSHNFVTIENKLAIIPQQISELNTQLTRAELKRKETETLYNKIKDISSNLDSAETISVIATDPIYQSLKQQMIKAEQTIMELSQKYGAKHPAMIRAIEERNALKARMEQEIKRIIESIKNEYELAKANEMSLRRRLSEMKGEAISLNEKFMEYGVINREVETNRQLYDALIKKIKEYSMTEQTRPVNVLILEKAETPMSPIKPRKTYNLMLGIIFGLLGGVGAAFFIEYLDNTVKSPEDAESKLGLPVIGMIPLLKSPEKPVEGIIISESTSAFAESYKALRTALILSSADKPPKKLLITSASLEEGKTATSINLAIAIAQSGYSVLLIDCDLRKPRIHKIFRMSNTKGLSTYLAGASDINILQEGPVPSLSIITSGPIPPNPSELLTAKRMKEMLDMFAERYDVIICDSPPVLTVADSLILSRIVDGTIIVTRSGKTVYDDVKKSLRSLDNINAHVLGMVINAIDLKKNDYYYYQYYNYYTSEDEKIRA